MGSNPVGCTNSSIYPQEFMTPADFLFADVVSPAAVLVFKLFRRETAALFCIQPESCRNVS